MVMHQAHDVATCVGRPDLDLLVVYYVVRMVGLGVYSGTPTAWLVYKDAEVAGGQGNRLTAPE